jgi:hypothetical protein
LQNRQALEFKEAGFGLATGRASRGFPILRQSAGVMEWWSNGALKNIKFQAPNLRVSGVGCQVSGRKTKRLKPEH